MKYVGNKLGQFKLVGKIKKGYFISPKLYCLKMDDGRTIIKSKGISYDNLSELDFEEMLYNLNKIIPIERFHKNMENLTINYKESKYKITHHKFKRKPIFENYKIVDTILLVVKENKIIQDNIINKFIYNLVLYNPNKYALIKSNLFLIKYNPNKYAIIKSNLN